MAKLSYSSSTIQPFTSSAYPDSTSNVAFGSDQEQVSQVQQLQVLLSVARMRRRSQRQLLVQIEQEHHKQRNGLGRTIHRVPQSLPCSIMCSSIEISRSCDGTIMEEVEDDDVKSVSSLNSLSCERDNS